MKRLASFLAAVGLIACVKGAHESLPENGVPGVMGDNIPAALDIPGPASDCPRGMVLIEGEYCPDVEEVCLQWVGADGTPSKAAIPTGGQTGRCGIWQSPTRCLSTHTVHKRFCVDKYEYPNVEGQRPESWMTWYDVKNACEAQGKRLCEKVEWTFACEGPQMKPYPYGDGYHRDRTSCNTDNAVPEDTSKPINKATGRHPRVDVLKVKERTSVQGQILDEMLVPSGSMPTCVSDFGVYDMVGNVDEFIDNPNGHHWKPPSENAGKVDRGPFISGLVSGHVFGVRNACRPMTDGHNESFSWYETGGRCCSDTTNDSRKTITP